MGEGAAEQKPEGSVPVAPASQRSVDVNHSNCVRSASAAAQFGKYSPLCNIENTEVCLVLVEYTRCTCEQEE